MPAGTGLAEVVPQPTADGARHYLEGRRAQLVLSLPAEQLLASASVAAAGDGRLLYSAAVADSGPAGIWLATWETSDGDAVSTLVPFPAISPAVEALAVAADGAASRIERLEIEWPDIAAAALRSRVQIIRAVAARAALGDAIRARRAEIRGPAVSAVAALAGVGQPYLYRVLRGEDWTWTGAGAGSSDLLSGERRRREWHEGRGPRPRRPARSDLRARAGREARPAARVDAAAASAEFAEMFEPIAAEFTRPESREHARRYLLRLLSRSPQLAGWPAVTPESELSSLKTQRLLRTDAWSADLVRDYVLEYVFTHLGEPEAVLVASEAAFAKQGTASAGVDRQYSAGAGRRINCQSGVFLTYVASAGAALIDRDLFLPQDWAADRDRCRRAGIGDDVAFTTRPQLAQAMIARVARAALPLAWVTADEACGQDAALRAWLDETGMSYVLPVSPDYPVAARGRTIQVAELTQRASSRDWRQLPAGHGRAASGGQEWLGIHAGRGGQVVLGRRAAGGGPASFFVCRAPTGTRLQHLVAVTGAQQAAADCLATAREEAGLGDYKVLHYDGWYRHITLSMVALAFLTALAAPRGR